jgi:hypothetical protein
MTDQIFSDDEWRVCGMDGLATTAAPIRVDLYRDSLE